MKPKLLVLACLALVLRLVFIFPQYSGDVKNHLVWSNSVLTSGTHGLYSRHFPGYNDVNYPPVSIFLFSANRYLYQNISSFIHWQNFHAKFIPSAVVPFIESENATAGFLKLPSVFADVLTGLIVYLLVLKRSSKNALWFASLYWFNPAVIYLSSVWGQIESIPIFFLVASYFFLTRGKSNDYWLSHLSFVLAILAKQTALWLLPVFLLIWWRQGSLQQLIKGLLLQLLVFFLLYLPFTTPLNALASYFGTLAGSSTSISDQAMNLWYFIFRGQPLDDSTKLLTLSVRNWSLILLSLSYLFVCWKLVKKYSLDLAGTTLFWLSIAAFFLQTRVHERHLAPALPFLLLSDYKTRTIVIIYLLLSVYHLLNLYTGLRLPFLW